MKRITQSILPFAMLLMLAGAPTVGLAMTTDANFQNALNLLRQARQDFKDSRAQVDSTSTQAGKSQVAQQKRAAAQKLMEQKRKTVLLNLVDIQIKWFTRTKERVQGMPNITVDLKTQLATEIDASIKTMNDEKTKIQNATGTEAVKSLANEVKDLFKTKKDIVQKIVDAILASRANIAAAKAEDRAAAIKAKIEQLKAAGKDTSALEADLADAQNKINDAQDKIGRKDFQAANDDLQGAYQDFRDIANKAKGL